MYTITKTPTGKFKVSTKTGLEVCITLTRISAEAIVRALENDADDFVERY